MQGKLTIRQIDKMRMLYESGETIPAIEQRLKIPQRTIYGYINKNGWQAPRGDEFHSELGDSPLEAYERQYLAKVSHIDQVTSCLLGSMGRSPEELSQLDDSDLTRIMKGMKALKMASEITDLHRIGVTDVLTKGGKVTEEVNVLPIHIEVSPPAQLENKPN